MKDFAEVTQQSVAQVEQLHGRGFFVRFVADTATAEAEEPTARFKRETLLGDTVVPDTMPRMASFELESFVVYPLRPETSSTGRLTVGRVDECNIVIDDGSVSRTHAELTLDSEGRLWVRDRDSTNGTLVSRRPVHPGDEAEVEFGKSVQFGQVKVTFMPAQQFIDFVRLVTGDF